MNDNFVIVRKSSVYSDSRGGSIAGSVTSPAKSQPMDDGLHSLKDHDLGMSAKSYVTGHSDINGWRTPSVLGSAEVKRKRSSGRPFRKSMEGAEAGNMIESHLAVLSANDEKN